MRALSICSAPGCRNTKTGSGLCAECRKRDRQQIDRRRPGARARGYDRKWARTRGAYLAKHPFCECDDCLRLPCMQRPPAVDVHHIDGLGPNGPRGHNWDNLLAMAHNHHARRTARDQPSGFAAMR